MPAGTARNVSRTYACKRDTACKLSGPRERDRCAFCIVKSLDSNVYLIVPPVRLSRVYSGHEVVEGRRQR
jgi:hypothetical protein